MKTPKPWFWTARKAWFVQLNGKQIRLHEEEREAQKEYFRIMAAEGMLGPRQMARMTVADAVESMCASAAHHRANTRRHYAYNLGPFASTFRGRRLDQVRPDEIISFVANYGGAGRYAGRPFGDSSRAQMFRYVKQLYRWARDTGVIQTNPMHSIASPWRVATRNRVMTEEEFVALMRDTKSHAGFKEALEIMWRTGARPSEVVGIEARHLDARLPIVRYQPTEHKTGTRTGLQREIVMPLDLMERLRQYAKDRPRGALLRGYRGVPLTRSSVSSSFNRSARRLGLLPGLVLYHARHAFLTRLLTSGNSAHLVAKLAGHTAAETLQRVYYHPDVVAMIDVVQQADVGEPAKIADIRSRVETARSETANDRRRRKRDRDRASQRRRRERLRGDGPPMIEPA